MNKLTGMLRVTPLTAAIDFDGVKMRVTSSHNGCTGCVFETKEQADNCQYRNSCMAHLRQDGKSVIFTCIN